MLTERVHTAKGNLTTTKIIDYAIFFKLRLSSLVLFSAFAGYVLAADTIIWAQLGFLMLGGFLVTASSNGFNQVIEKDLDKLMERTKDRPVATGRMSVMEGIMVAFIAGSIGLFILFYFLNPLTGFLGLLALVLYVGVYTPLKRISSVAVFVGAIPGALPPMLGWVAATGTFGMEAGLLFAVQFFWQFPHFWAIAWKCDEDYRKAGFHLLPSREGKGASSAFQIMIYALVLIPISLTPLMFNISGYMAAGVALVAGIWFLSATVKLFRSRSDKDATRVMFISFAYLPIVFIAFIIDKI